MDEATERERLADAIRMLERLGIIDFNGHRSSRLATGEIRVNSGRSVRSAIAADDIVAIDGDGRLLRGSDVKEDRRRIAAAPVAGLRRATGTVIASVSTPPVGQGSGKNGWCISCDFRALVEKFFKRSEVTRQSIPTPAVLDRHAFGSR